ncbi:MAG: hypothetical protein K9I74_14190 [Bacteroidales bacterium]|nr:hypothetical protein [Bacteroidales bacterium]
MNIIRVRRKIASSRIRISELKELIGKQVEIIVKETEPAKGTFEGKNVYGILSGYKDTQKSYQEKQAWELIAREKHGNR